ncbi:MAG: helix-turn-helix domain-containing protein [Alphaproteobacteria bacterium]|nr:helix-turn-helix domain-containing protein [Alphaproteobacteria bacterium]
MTKWTGKQTAQEHASQSGMGDRIRNARQTAGLTQVGLAAAVGVSRSAIAQWETDRSGQVGVNLARVATVLSVSPTYLLNGTVGPEGDGTAESPQEMAILRLYRKLDEADQQVLLRLAIRLAREK